MKKGKLLLVETDCATYLVVANGSANERGFSGTYRVAIYSSEPTAGSASDYNWFPNGTFYWDEIKSFKVIR